MEYKKIYTQEELNDLFEWMKQHIPNMPESLQLNDATFIPNLPMTAEYYLELSEMHKLNPTYGGQIHHLFEIRECLEKMGL
jgi:hypothetical protein